MTIRSALVKLNNNVSVPDQTQQTVSWEAAEHDNAKIWDPATPTRLTVPAGATHVVLTCYLAFANTTGDHWCEMIKNGVTEVASGLQTAAAVNDNERVYAQTPVLEVAGGDYFEARAWLADGPANLMAANTTFFSMEVLDPPGLDSGASGDAGKKVQTIALG